MADIDASTVEYNQGGFGAVVRKVDRRLHDYVSVKDFGAIGNGATDDSTSVNKAISFAKSNGCSLYWPTGVYLCASNLADFHNIPQSGEGKVKRGTDVFHITPPGAALNRIYFSATGNNSNDGLTADKPKQSLSELTRVLQSWNEMGRLSSGKWQFKLAAGEWINEQIKISFNILSCYAIEIVGEATSDPWVPATKIRQTGTIKQGYWIEPGGNVEIRNVWCLGFDRTVSASYGFLHKGYGQTKLFNCKASNVSNGFSITGSCSGLYETCHADNCQTGFSAAFGAAFTFGHSTESQGCKATNCQFYGAQGASAAIGHIDHFIIEDCGIAAVNLIIGAQAITIGGSYKRCPIGINLSGGAQWNDGGVNFNSGTPDACTIIFRSAGNALSGSVFEQATQLERRVGCDTAEFSIDTPGLKLLTNIVAATNQARFVMPAYFFADSKKTIKLRVWGTRSGSGSKVIRFAVLKNVSFDDYQVLYSSYLGAHAGGYYIEVVVTAKDVGLQEIQSTYIANTGTAVVANTSSAVNFTVDRIFRIYGETTDTTDTLTVNRYEMFVCG